MLKKKYVKRIGALAIAMVVGFTSTFAIPELSKAAENRTASVSTTESTDTQEPEKNQFLITSFKALTSTQKSKTIVAYSSKNLNLPATLTATVETGATVRVPVKWKCTTAFSKKIAGTYYYKGTLDEKYTLAKNVTIPKITVKVTKANTNVTGIATSITKKARKSMYDTVFVYNGYGRTMKLQKWNGSKWVTKKSFKLKNTGSQKVKVTYTNDWWKVTSSKWRLYIPSNKGLKLFKSSTVKVKTKRYYQNPSKYIQIQDKIKIDNSGGYTVKYGYMGLKTKRINNYFGIGDKNWPRYTGTTKEYVKAFQRKKGLKVTGNVNKATWLKMGYSEYSWYNMGAYVSPIKVNPSSTRKQHVEAMIDRAYDYLGSSYVVGASGKPSQGADCSGLVMQCLYAAGIEMPGINPVTHSWAGHEYESRNMWERGVFKKIPYSEKRRGDLIFYKDSRGVVNHVAIYLGDGKVIESWPNYVRVANVRHHAIMGAMRVFHYN